MNTQALYNQIKQELNADWMPTLDQAPLRVSVETAQNYQAWSEIANFQPTQGWIQTLDQINSVDKFNPEQEKEAIISAEMVNAKGQTLHIRPAFQDKVTVTTYKADGESLYFYTETSHQVKLKKNTANAQYRLYWPQGKSSSEFSEDQVLRQPQFSIFIGFDFKENN